MSLAKIKNENGNNNDKNMNNVWGDKQPKRKVKFPCKLCKDDRLMEDASKFIALGPAMFTNPLLNNKNMNSRTVDPGCAQGGNQNMSEANSDHGCINMVRATKVVTRAKHYGSSQPDLGKEPSLEEIWGLKWAL